MEFKGIVNLDPQIAKQLNRYIMEKETELGLKIIRFIDPLDIHNPELETPEIQSLSLGEAVLFFGKKVRAMILDRESHQLHEDIHKKITQECWQFLTLLENYTEQFFKEMSQHQCISWNEELINTVKSIKTTLINALDDLEWAVKRLNAQLFQLKRGVLNLTYFDKLKRYASGFGPESDRALLKNLEKTRKFLTFYGLKFQDNCAKYQILQQDVKKHVIKLANLEVLNTLYSDSKETFIKVYECLKMWEINQQSKLIPSADLEKPLKNVIDPKRVSHIFEEYHSLLLKKVFEISGLLKFERNEILEHGPMSTQLEVSLKRLLKEIHLLGSTVTSYRKFLLKTDPDPYVRSRFGFPEWIVGEEPASTKNMLLINYDIEEMNFQVEEMLHALQSAGTGDEVSQLNKIHLKLEPVLHEMAQPLVTESTMKELAEKACGYLKEVKELTSLELESVNFIGRGLSSLLKADWKYQVLFGIPEFEKIYAIHMGLFGESHENRDYLNRLDELRRHCKELKDLVKGKSFYNHLQEIDFTINDIKGSLQDFLGYVQRLAQEPSISSETKRDLFLQLLEVRYFFGHYFHELGTLGDDKSKILNKLHFVDQYLDAIDTVIQDKP